MKCRGTVRRFYEILHLIAHLSLIMPRAKSECLLAEKLHRLLFKEFLHVIKLNLNPYSMTLSTLKLNLI